MVVTARHHLHALVDAEAILLVQRNLTLESLLELDESIEALMKHGLHAPIARIVMILLVQLLE